MQLALVEMQRRVQSRVPLPWIQADGNGCRTQRAAGRPIVRFGDIPLEWTDFRLTFRQTADILRRLRRARGGRPRRESSRWAATVTRWSRWSHAGMTQHPAWTAATRAIVSRRMAPASLDQVLVLALRPFLARCAEALVQRTEVAPWHHGHCPFCGWEPDFAVITPNADRRLICGRCVGAVGVRAADLPLLRERRPHAHHVVCHARRPVSRLRVRRLPPLSEGVRRREARPARSWSRSIRLRRCRSMRPRCSAATWDSRTEVLRYNV